MSFLGLQDKTIVVTGLGSRRSVAWHAGRLLEEQGARVVYSVRSAQRRQQLQRLLEEREVHVCDVQDQGQIDTLVRSVSERHPRIHGLVHSLAFANFESFSGQFHEVRREDFLQAVDVSCFSLIALASAFRPLFDEQASVVTLSISTVHMAAESYGYLAPAKAALDSAVTFLAKSFSRFSKVRFNAVKAGLLKTNSSAGIPNYLENYLFAELATLRKEALTCAEVAGVVAFLLSPRSSGINAQGIVVDCGMSRNYFDASIVRPATQAAWPAGNTARTPAAQEPSEAARSNRPSAAQQSAELRPRPAVHDPGDAEEP